MKSNIKKKLLSGIAVLAVSATAVAGAITFTTLNRGGSPYNDGVTDLKSNVIATAVGAAVQKGGGKTYYVSPDGSAESTGESKSSPTTIPALMHTAPDANVPANPSSLPKLQAGDTVIVMDGTYKLNERVILWADGTFDNYIKIIPDENAKPVLDFTNMTFDGNNRGLSIYGDYVYWKGIDIMGAGDNGMYVAGSYNVVEDCEFSFNRDTGLQLGRHAGSDEKIYEWPNYNLIKNCTSHNNYDNESKGENADGFAAKLTVGYGNVFDGCIAYRNSDDGWDLYAKGESGNIGCVILYNCVAFENGFIETPQKEYNEKFANKNAANLEGEVWENRYTTANGDGNGFKLGGESMEAEVIINNCLAFNNRLHGFTDNSNPGVISITNCTSYDNGRKVDDDETHKETTFGEVINEAIGTESKDWSANVDLSRHEYSYNLVNRVLSVHGQLSKNIKDDAYRGTVRDSLLVTNGSKTYKIEGNLDADSKNGIRGTETTAPNATEIFEKLPIELTGTTYKYNLSGKDSYKKGDGQTVHEYLRNPDGSINMQGFLKIKDRGAFIDGVDLGADLCQDSQSKYPVYEADSVLEGADTEAKNVIARAKNALTVPVDLEAVYQDFELPLNMGPVKVSWTSANEDLVTIGTEVKSSKSGTEYVTAVVHRQPDADKTVTITATLTYEGVTDTAEIELVILKNQFKLGDLIVTDQNGDPINDGDNIILDLYTIYKDPTVVVTNGYDYNGKLLPEDQYSVTATYEYQENGAAPKIVVKGFTPSHAGVYTITYKAKLNVDSSETSMSYKVYTAGTAAEVDFMDDPIVSINRNGLEIRGDLTSATGYIYTVISKTKLENTVLNAENIKTYTGVDKKDFRDVSPKFSYANANSEAYYVYFALGNMNGDVTSEVYEQAITVQEITTHEQFRTIAEGKTIASENPSTTIYKLMNDLDFTSKTWSKMQGTEAAFKGLFNGNGKTISHITLQVTDAGTKQHQATIFRGVDGGTIMNVKFEEITLESNYRSVALVGQCNGGYFYNIAMKNIALKGSQRVAGLIGNLNETPVVPVSIEQVSIDNDSSHKFVASGETDSRVGGLIGLIQCEGTADSIGSQVYIDNCFVHTDFEVASGVGGMVGCYEDESEMYVLNVSHSAYVGNITASSGVRCGGIVGYHKGGKAFMNVDTFLSVIPQFMANDINVNEVPQKNASAFVGQHVAELETFKNCLSVAVAAYDTTDYDEGTFDNVSLKTFESLTYNRLSTMFDCETRWSVKTQGVSSSVQAVSPYLSLNFLGDWE